MIVQLNILSGKMAGTRQAARHFPFQIGRAVHADLRLDDAGIWEQHLELVFDPKEGFSLKTVPPALAAINGESFTESPLRNGDTIDLGATRISFWLGETHQSSLALREVLTWAGCLIVVIVQLFLIYRLMR